MSIVRISKDQPKPMHAGRIIKALARHFDPHANRLMTEFFVDGGLADLAVITRSGYLTEIEVKISRSDWKADAAKDKWAKPRPHVARFFYAVPEALAKEIPEWVPAHAGVLAVYQPHPDSSDYCREIRPARRFRADKMTDRHMRTLFESAYSRFWRSELYGRRRLAEIA
jgi:hypothetical protein